MRIELRKGKEVVVITFHTNAARFESDYERTNFFRKLHGWTQVVPRNGKRYEYRREGLLDTVPHEKIADSVFLVAREHMRLMERFFDEWQDKVDYEMMEFMAKGGRRFINHGGND
ncbi:MAG: hypothetical protein HY365_00140 [Candidatus Aenigmarchaeota archaeon]|nr:hypothetical protein [Candidatus Aenigmarchaeota archaeon]